MDNKVTYKIDAIDKITPVYRTLIGLQNKAARSVTQTNSGINEANRSMNQLANTTASAGVKISNATKYGVLRFQRVKKTVDDTEKSVKKTGSSLDWLRGRVQGVERRATMMGNRVTGALTSITNRLGGVGTAMAGIFSFQIAKQGFDVLTEKASDLNESASKAKTVFGGAYAQIEKLANKSAYAMGLSKEATLAATSQYAGLFKNIGFGENKTAQFSEASVRLAADLASFNNMPMNEALEALLATLKGESEPAMRFGVLIDEASLKQKAFDMGLIKTTKETLPKAIKTQAIFAQVLAQTKDAQGDFAKTSLDVANRTRTLTAVQEEMQATLGQKLLPIKLKFVNLLIKSFEWVKANADAVIDWGQKAIYLTGALVGVYAAAKTILVVANMYKTVTTAITLLRNSTTIAKIAMIAFNFVASMSPFGWIALAIGGIILIVKHWDKVKVYLTKFAAWVWKNHPFRWMIDLIDRVFPGFKASLSKIFDWLKETFLQVAKWVYDNVIKPIFGWALEMLDIPITFDVQKPEMPNVNGLAKPFMAGAAAGNTLTWAKSLVKTPENKDASAYYNSILGGAGDLGDTKNNPSGKGAPGVKDSMEGLVSGGGKEMKNINIRIDKLIESFTVSTETFGLSANQIKAEVQKILLSAVNEVNYQ